MSGKIILRSLALLVAAISFSAIRLAAQDQPSVADAARRSREQKKDTSKPSQVITNDTLPPNPAADSSAPAAPAAPDSAAQAKNASASSDKKEAGDSSEDAEKKEKIKALKQEIADKQQSINLLQREIALAQDSFFSNPDHGHDKAGKEKLDSMQSDVKQQQAELAEIQAKLAELGPEPDTKSPETPKP